MFKILVLFACMPTALIAIMMHPKSPLSKPQTSLPSRSSGSSAGSSSIPRSYVPSLRSAQPRGQAQQLLASISAPNLDIVTDIKVPQKRAGSAKSTKKWTKPSAIMISRLERKKLEPPLPTEARAVILQNATDEVRGGLGDILASPILPLPGMIGSHADNLPLP